MLRAARPKMIAVDMYDRIEGGPSMEIMFAKLAKEMRVLGLAETPIVVQETYYNHKPSYHAIVAASEQHGWISTRSINGRWTPPTSGTTRRPGSRRTARR